MLFACVYLEAAGGHVLTADADTDPRHIAADELFDTCDVVLSLVREFFEAAAVGDRLFPPRHSLIDDLDLTHTHTWFHSGFIVVS